jgi:hypothetical protein
LVIRGLYSAEWAPVGRLKDAGLVAACGYMLNTAEFRDAACDVMRQLAGELAPVADTSCGLIFVSLPMCQTCFM